MQALNIALGKAVNKASYETSFQPAVLADDVCRTNGWLSHYYPHIGPRLFQSNTIFWESSLPGDSGKDYGHG